MNHSHQVRHTAMELKVCEGCGALWLRAGCPGTGLYAAAANGNAYCKRCVRALAELPAPAGPRKPSRVRVRIRPRKLAVMPLLVSNGGAR